MRVKHHNKKGNMMLTSFVPFRNFSPTDILNAEIEKLPPPTA